MREAELRETARTFSAMMQLLEQWINDPKEVAFAQHNKDITNHLRQLWHKKGLRFTLVRGDGVVLLDGAVQDRKDMDNHLSRPEIQDALVYGRGVSVRYSDTMDGDMIYVAEPFMTEWGTLYLRLAASPDIIQHRKLTYVMMALMAITGILLIKLC